MNGQVQIDELALTPTAFYFLRHGATDGEQGNRKLGRADTPLNEEGKRQAAAGAEILASREICTICCSPLARAQETAEILGETLNQPIVTIDELREVDWGTAEGQAVGPWYFDWFRGINPEGAESYDNFIRRAVDGINASLAKDGPVLIVAHGSVFWAIQKYAHLGADASAPIAIPVHLSPPGENSKIWQSDVLS